MRKRMLYGVMWILAINSLAALFCLSSNYLFPSKPFSIDHATIVVLVGIVAALSAREV